MLVREMKFQDLDRKWFLLEDLKAIKRINRLFRFKKTTYPLLCYTYIDHESGISLRVVGHIYVDDGALHLDQESIDRRLDILRYSEIEKLDLIPLDKEIIKLIEHTKTVEEEMNIYYDSHSDVLITRIHTELDEFRDTIFVDDIEFLVIAKEKEPELLKARIKSFDSINKLYLCELLTKSKKGYDIEIGKLIYLKYIDRPKYRGLVFVKTYEEA